MSEFWEGFWFGVLGYILLRNALGMLKMYLIKRLLLKVVDDLKEQQGEILLRLEKHGDMYYCYRKDTEEFVGQAKTVEEIGDMFKKKYPFNEGKVLKEDAQGV